MNGGFLLDTNIPSELMRPRPEPKVTSWIAAQDLDAQQRARLEASLQRHLAVLFPGRILPVTPIAARWGRLDGMRALAGRPLSVPDGMIAATAIEHGLTVVTRNTKDFAGLAVTLINPWLDQ